MLCLKHAAARLARSGNNQRAFQPRRKLIGTDFYDRLKTPILLLSGVNSVMIIPLLVASGTLLFAGGIHSLLLPIVGSSEGFDSLAMGAIGAAWAVGYVLGCLMVPRLVGSVGHIRSFSIMAAIAGVSVLLASLYVHPVTWMLLRVGSGIAFAGGAMIIEGWLTDTTRPERRGQVFGVYTMVNLTASTLGQFSLSLAPEHVLSYFTLAAVFYCLALIPVSGARITSPTPLVQAKLEVREAFRNSPVALVCVLLLGASNGAFVALGPVFAEAQEFNLFEISLFVSLPVFVGALAQFPVGQLSDRYDRRLLIVGLAALAGLIDIAFLVVQPAGAWSAIILISLAGFGLFSLYPVILAHANDHARPGQSLTISATLLLVYGLGSVAGPILAGVLMSLNSAFWLFVLTLFAHVLMIAFTLYRMTRRDGVVDGFKANFVAVGAGRILTPQTVAVVSEEAERQEMA